MAFVVECISKYCVIVENKKKKLFKFRWWFIYFHAKHTHTQQYCSMKHLIFYVTATLNFSKPHKNSRKLKSQPEVYCCLRRLNVTLHHRSAMNRFFAFISTHEILNTRESTTLKFNYSYLLQRWFVSTGCNEYAYNVDIKLIPFEICLIPT